MFGMCFIGIFLMHAINEISLRNTCLSLARFRTSSCIALTSIQVATAKQVACSSCRENDTISLMIRVKIPHWSLLARITDV